MALLSTKTGLPSFSDVDQSIINIVDNPSARRDTTGWTAATNYSVTRDISNSPLAGVIDSCFAISTTTASTESSTSGVYAASLAMPAALRNSKVQGNLWVTVPATSAGVWRLSVYNASGTRMTLDRDTTGVFTLPGGYTGQLPFTFDADSSATYTISFTQTTRTSANTLYMTNISIGNGITAQGAAVGPFESTTSYTIGATTTPPTAGAGATYYRNTFRDGDWAEIRWEFQQTNTGTAGTGAYILPLPTGLTIDFTRVTVVSSGNTTGSVGTGLVVSSGTSYRANVIARAANSSTGVIVSLMDDLTAETNFGASLAPLSGAAVSFSIIARIPISEWAGSVSTAPVPAEEFVFNTSGITAAGSVDTTSFGYGPLGALIGSIASTTGSNSTTSMRVRFQYPIQSDDELILEFDGGTGGARWLNATQCFHYGLFQGTSIYGAYFNLVNSTDVDVVFGNKGRLANNVTYGGDGAPWSGVSSVRWRVRKTKKAALPFANAGTDGSAGLYKAGQAPGYTGGAISTAGYLGYMAGTQRAGTGGSSYSTRSTTAVTSSAAVVNSITLNKGVYLVSGAVQTLQGDGAARRLIAYLAVGTTQIQNGVAIESPNNALQTVLTGMVPIVITTDGTVVGLYAQMVSMSGATSNNNHELWVTQIA